MNPRVLPRPTAVRFALIATAFLFATSAGCRDGGDGGGDAAVDAYDGTTRDTTPGGRDGHTGDSGAEISVDTAADTHRRDGSADGAADADDSGTSACALPSPFDEDASYTETLYVDPNAGSGGDGSSGSPFRTLDPALSDAGPGTKIVLRKGTHDPGTYASSLKGSNQSPIAIVGRDGAVIQGGDTGLQLSDVEWLVLENVTVRGANLNGINIDDGGDYSSPSQHLILREVVVENIGTGGNNDCIKLSGVDDFQILDSEVSSCTGQGIDMVGCHRGWIRRSTVSRMEVGIQSKGGSADVAIHATEFRETTQRAINAGGSTGLQYFRPNDAPHEAKNIRAFGNLFVDVDGTSIAYVGCDGCEFYNNTLVRPSRWIARILQETTGSRFVPSRDGRFANNIVYFRTADIRTWVNVGPDTEPMSFTFTNNLWFATDDSNFNGPNFSGVPSGRNRVVQQDPAFRDPAGGDFHIPSSSPAAGAGTTIGDYPDHEGTCYGTPPAIGAFAAQ